jgi:hypothetical protein
MARLWMVCEGELLKDSHAWLFTVFILLKESTPALFYSYVGAW